MDPEGVFQRLERIACQYAAENESKIVLLAMDNHGVIHKEFADFIAATARIAEKLCYANICTLVQLASFYVI